MDDHEEARVAALFRDAAAGAPPPGFDAAQVVATSRRISRRRRSAVAGAALAVLAVAGIGVVAGLGGPGEATVTAAGQAAERDSAAGSAGGADDAARAMAPEAAAAPDTGAPSAAAAPGVPAVPPIGAPLGPGTGDCADRQDPALRALVDEALPEVVGAQEAPTTMECRPGGERGVALEVDGGILTVTYLPSGATVQVVEGARTAPTASGGTVVVSSRAGRAGDPEPFANRLDAVVAHLAPRL
jgi:hypothetical protein